jgi:hypothetical protein
MSRCASAVARLASACAASRGYARPPARHREDLFAREQATVTAAELVRLMNALDVRPYQLAPAAKFTEYFGTRVEVARETSITFDRDDARAPFVTAKAGMGSFFQPELRRQLDDPAQTRGRDLVALLEHVCIAPRRRCRTTTSWRRFAPGSTREVLVRSS